MSQNHRRSLRPLLILDLDETLIHASEELLDWSPDLVFDRFFIYCRPYLNTFLNACFGVYDLAIWSSGTSTYVNAIVAKIFFGHPSPLFIWSNERCTPKTDFELNEIFYEKNLKKVSRKGFSMKQILIVDDNHKNCRKNYGNALIIPAFKGDPADKELEALGDFLLEICDSADFRIINKRKWR